jgi:hypothetical protein
MPASFGFDDLVKETELLAAADQALMYPATLGLALIFLTADCERCFRVVPNVKEHLGKMESNDGVVFLREQPLVQRDGSVGKLGSTSEDESAKGVSQRDECLSRVQSVNHRLKRRDSFLETVDDFVGFRKADVAVRDAWSFSNQLPKTTPGFLVPLLRAEAFAVTFQLRRIHRCSRRQRLPLSRGNRTRKSSTYDDCDAVAAGCSGLAWLVS